MSEKLDGIDLNSDAVTVEAIDEASGGRVESSANETLREYSRFDMGGQSGGGSSGDGFRVLGEVKESGNGVFWGVNVETGVKSGDLEGKNGSAGSGIAINNRGFGSGPSSVYGFNVFGGAKGFGNGVSEGVNGGIEIKNGDLEGRNARVGGGINLGFVKWASSVDGFRGVREAKDSANVVSECVNREINVKGRDLKGKNSGVGHEIGINNDGFVTGLKVDGGEYYADSVCMGGERENMVTGMAETRSGNVLLEYLTSGMGESEGKVVNDETNVVGVIKGVGNGVKVNIPVDLNVRHGVGKDHLSGNGIGNRKPGVVEVLDESNVPLYDGGVNNATSFNKGVSPHENRDAVIKEQCKDVNLEFKDGNDLNVVPLRPKIRGEESQTEKEGEYYLLDLVWGKVRGHPWWPGQIFEPSAASEKAVKYFKKDSYLIAYFGDETFAWNEAAKIKPFRKHFTQMEKQSNVETLCRAVDCALDEFSRRVEFGLSCSCLPEKQRAKIASQTIVNAGIREEASTRYGGDYISSASTFVPAELLQDFKSLAVAPNSGIDRLRFVIGRAQLLAFNRWKGFYQLPELVEVDGLSEKGADFPALAKEEGSDEAMVDKVQGSRADGEASSGKVQLGRDNSSRKRKHGSGHEECLKKDEKSVADMLSDRSPVSENGEKKSKGKRGRKKGSVKKNEANESVSSDSKLKRRKRILSPTSTLQSVQEISQSVRGISSQKLLDTDVGVSSPGSGKPQRKKLLPADIPPPEEMLSKLCLAASDPKEGYRSIYSFISLFSAFRNSICLQVKITQQCKRSTEGHKGEKTSTFDTFETFGSEGIEDSYWTDRIVQSNYEEQELFDPESLEEKTTTISELGNAYDASPNMNNKERDAAVLESEAENPAVSMDENTEEYSPTALSLKFSDLESVPSVMDLNSIFSRFGPINESQTQVLSKTKRAKVVFKRRSDAEIAFSSAGKFSVFGPSLLCYRLKPLTVKAPTVTKRKRKGAKSE